MNARPGFGGSGGPGGEGGRGGDGGSFSGKGGNGGNGGSGHDGGRGGNAGNGGAGGAGGDADGGGIYVSGGELVIASVTTAGSTVTGGVGGAGGVADGKQGVGGQSGAGGSGGAGGTGASFRHGGRAADGDNGKKGAGSSVGPEGAKGTPGAQGSDGQADDPGDFGGGSSAQTLMIVITSPPPASVAVGASFGLTAKLETSQGQVVTSFNGNMTIVLTANPGGAVLGGKATVRAANGVAVFSGLSLNKPGNGYQLEATSGGTYSAPVSINVVNPIPPPPTIIGELPIFSRKLNKRGKPVGKPVLTGFEIEYSTAMDPATAGISTNYQVELDLYQAREEKEGASVPPVGDQGAV